MNAPIRILTVTTGLNRGGAESMLIRLLSRLDRKRFAPSVLSILERGPLSADVEELDIPLAHLGMKIGRPNPLKLWPLLQHIGKVKPNIILGWMYHGNLASTLAVRLMRKQTPVIWNIRQSLYDFGYESRGTAALIRLGARWSKHPKKIVYNAQVSAEQHESLGYSTPQRLVIPNGFDAGIFKPNTTQREQIRPMLGIHSQAFVIGMIARFHPMKDHNNFLRAASELRQSHPDVEFLLVGKDVTPRNETLSEKVAELQLGNHVHMVGEQTNTAAWMNAMDIATSSSFTEGFSNVVGEAMMCGVPCVVTDVGDSAYIVGKTGRVVPARSPQALANAWRELLTLSAQERIQLGQCARDRAMKHFSLNQIVNQYETLYGSVSANPQS